VSGHGGRRAELGQHFLAGGRLAAELVEQAGVGPGDLAVEIGAGTGVLTEALARRAGRVVAVERDPRLADRARTRLAGFGNVRVVTAHALVLPPPRRPFRVVANLPFGSTAAMSLTYRQLRRLARDLDFPLDARPADLDAVQWAGLYAVVDSGRPGKTGGKPVG
jgi:16S rRNA A1518/A1519 N6-dimethyltransferase RsmA/KsgA/DIM1 with predicted DNA glycosylase/AP lyase activity